jgi:hypothetical protein
VAGIHPSADENHGSRGGAETRRGKNRFPAIFDVWKSMIFTRSREVAKKDDHEKFFLKRAPH